MPIRESGDGMSEHGLHGVGPDSAESPSELDAVVSLSEPGHIVGEGRQSRPPLLRLVLNGKYVPPVGHGTMNNVLEGRR